MEPLDPMSDAAVDEVVGTPDESGATFPPVNDVSVAGPFTSD